MTPADAAPFFVLLVLALGLIATLAVLLQRCPGRCVQCRRPLAAAGPDTCSFTCALERDLEALT